MKVLSAALFLTVTATTAQAQINAGEKQPEASLPFTMTQVATFNLPWRIAFLPDGRMLITEKPGALWLVTQQGAKTPVANVPRGAPSGAGRHAGRVRCRRHYATDHNVYLTYSEPGDGGSSLAMARARLAIADSAREPGRDCRCCGDRCPRAGAVSSVPRSPFLRTASTCSCRSATVSV